jgi:hypothetical protein
VCPCLWVKQSNSGIVMMVIYVNDCLTIGSDEAIKDIIEDLKQYDFGLKVEEYHKDHLSCHINIDKKDGIS